MKYNPKSYGWKEGISSEELDQVTHEILQKMSFYDKVELMGEQSFFSRLKMGLGVILKKPRPFESGGNKTYKIPPILFSDGPRGVTFSGGRSTVFPVSMARGASWDIDLERRVGDAIGKEARSIHSNYSGSVCINLLRHPAWGRAQETYGEDSWHVGEMGAALMSGIQEHNVLACIKHFAANSIENTRYVVSANMDERTLREVYLPHFKKCIDRGAMTFMSAYNKINGEYCGHSKYLLTDILRNEWNFKGYVTSDWDNGIYETVKPIKAGMNVEMSYAKFLTRKKVKHALNEGEITETDIDHLIAPTIRTQIWLASRTDTQTYPSKLLGAKKHIALAREVAENSAVLLKNENQLLPFNKNKIKRIAVVGSLATVRNTGDKGSSWTRQPKRKIVSPYEGIKNYFKGKDVSIITVDGRNIDELANVCKNADIVVVSVGMKYKDEGEFISPLPMKMKERYSSNRNFLTITGYLGIGGDRDHLSLDQHDINTIKIVNSIAPNMVVCIVGGSAITVEDWHRDTPAILQTFYNGMEGGNALARILFGDVNPSGKLPFVVPVSEKDLPDFDHYAKEIDYGYYHGYTLMDKKQITPRFPFGFGLSYTTFSFSHAEVKKPIITPKDILEVCVHIENTGKVSGQEVAQLYIGFLNSKVDRPVKLLRGFTKVSLDPGQKKTVTFIVNPNDLTFYNPNTKMYEVENMEHEVYIGNTSETARLIKSNFKTEGFN